VIPIILQNADNLRYVVVFRSFAKGSQTPDSDLDLYIGGRLKYRPDDILDTEQKLSEALSIRVDLITRAALTSSVIKDKLQQGIEQDGVCFMN